MKISEIQASSPATVTAIFNLLIGAVSFATGVPIASTDSLIIALGKLQAQINANTTSIGGKQSTLVSGTNIKTINSTSLLGSGDIAISASAAGSTNQVQVNNAGAFAGFSAFIWDIINSALGIGGNPAATAALDVQSTTKGVLVPRMTSTQMNAITSPATGLMVFNTTLNIFCSYNGAVWATVDGLPVSSIPGASIEKVLSISGTGGAPIKNAQYGLLDAYSASATTAANLDAATFSGSPVTATLTGVQGEKRAGANYNYECIATNTWTRTPTGQVNVDIFGLGSVADSSGRKTSAYMLANFASALPFQIVQGVNGYYQYFGTPGWVYVPNDIVSQDKVGTTTTFTTTTYTTLSTDELIIANPTTAATVTLGAAANYKNQFLTIKNITAFAVAISGGFANDPASIGAYGCNVWFSDGTTWYLTSKV